MSETAGLASWWGFGASVTGATHLRRNAPNEDHFAVFEFDGSCTVAIADGHGSRRACRSATGARLAVEAIGSVVSARRIGDLPGVVADATVNEWVGLVHEHAETVPFTPDELSGAECENTPEAGDLLMAYGTTVVAAATDGRYLVCWQIGDGCVIVVDENGPATFGIEPEHRIVTTETSSLALPDATLVARITERDLQKEPAMAVLLCTDGLSDAFVDEGWEQPVADHVLMHIRSTAPSELSALAEKWLEGPAAVYGDDATLAVMTCLRMA